MPGYVRTYIILSLGNDEAVKTLEILTKSLPSRAGVTGETEGRFVTIRRTTNRRSENDGILVLVFPRETGGLSFLSEKIVFAFLGVEYSFSNARFASRKKEEVGEIDR